MSFAIVDDDHYYEDQNTDLGFIPLIPVVLFAGGAAAATAVSAAMNEGWSIGDYDYYMSFMDRTIKEWDALGWDRGCWKKSPSTRASWVRFGQAFSKQYAKGVLSQQKSVLYLSDSYENPAKNLLKELQGWGERLNKLCAAGTGTIQPSDPSPDAPPPKSPTESLTDLLRWGVYGVAAVVGLNIFQTLRPRK